MIFHMFGKQSIEMRRLFSFPDFLLFIKKTCLSTSLIFFCYSEAVFHSKQVFTLDIGPCFVIVFSKYLYFVFSE